MFYTAMGAYTLLAVTQGLLPAGTMHGLRSTAGWIAVASGPVALYAMTRIYRIKPRPYWDHWQVATSFCGSMLSLGTLVVAYSTPPS